MRRLPQGDTAFVVASALWGNADEASDLDLMLLLDRPDDFRGAALAHGRVGGLGRRRPPAPCRGRPRCGEREVRAAASATTWIHHAPLKVIAATLAGTNPSPISARELVGAWPSRQPPRVGAERWEAVPIVMTVLRAGGRFAVAVVLRVDGALAASGGRADPAGISTGYPQWVGDSGALDPARDKFPKRLWHMAGRDGRSDRRFRSAQLLREDIHALCTGR